MFCGLTVVQVEPNEGCKQLTMEAMLVLEDGRVFCGRGYGAPGERFGDWCDRVLLKERPVGAAN